MAAEALPGHVHPRRQPPSGRRHRHGKGLPEGPAERLPAVREVPLDDHQRLHAVHQPAPAGDLPEAQYPRPLRHAHGLHGGLRRAVRLGLRHHRAGGRGALHEQDRRPSERTPQGAPGEDVPQVRQVPHRHRGPEARHGDEGRKRRLHIQLRADHRHPSAAQEGGHLAQRQHLGERPACLRRAAQRPPDLLHQLHLHARRSAGEVPQEGHRTPCRGEHRLLRGLRPGPLRGHRDPRQQRRRDRPHQGQPRRADGEPHVRPRFHRRDGLCQPGGPARGEWRPGAEAQRGCITLLRQLHTPLQGLPGCGERLPR